MRNLKWTLLVVLMAAPVAFMGCPADDTEGTEFTKCASDAECSAAGEGYICHPKGKICVLSCADDTECTGAETLCAQIQGASAKACTCADADCAADTEVCSDVDDVCTPKCATDADCSFADGRTCDTATGQCKIAGCTADTDCKADAAKPICEAGACVAKCTETSCTDGKVCGDDGHCAAAPACDSTKPMGQDGCAYGELCLNTTCTPVAGTCGAAAHNQSVADQSPVVWDVQKDGTRVATEPKTQGGTCDRSSAQTAADTCACPTADGTVQIFKGNWYDPQGDLATSNTYQKIAYVKKDGTVPTGWPTGQTYKNTSITKNADGKTGTFMFELCKSNDIVANAQGVFILDNASHESNVGCFSF